MGGLQSRLCSLPYLQLTGDQDCANSVSLQALPIWRNVTSGCGRETPRVLADITGATHCQWTTPVLGSCPFDKTCPVPRLERQMQQDIGLTLLGALGQNRVEEELHELG